MTTEPRTDVEVLAEALDAYNQIITPDDVEQGRLLGIVGGNIERVLRHLNQAPATEVTTEPRTAEEALAEATWNVYAPEGSALRRLHNHGELRKKNDSDAAKILAALPEGWSLTRVPATADVAEAQVAALTHTCPTCLVTFAADDRGWNQHFADHTQIAALREALQTILTLAESTATNSPLLSVYRQEIENIARAALASPPVDQNREPGEILPSDPEYPWAIPPGGT